MKERYEAAIESYNEYRRMCRKLAVRILSLGALTSLFICVLLSLLLYWIGNVNMKIVVVLVSFLAVFGILYSALLAIRQQGEFKKRSIAFFLTPEFEKMFGLEFENTQFADAYGSLLKTVSKVLVLASNPLVYSCQEDLIRKFCAQCGTVYRQMLIVQAVEQMFGPAGMVPIKQETSFLSMITEMHRTISGFHRQIEKAIAD